MAVVEQPKAQTAPRRVRPHVVELARKIVEEDRDVLEALAAYDRGQNSRASTDPVQGN